MEIRVVHLARTSEPGRTRTGNEGRWGALGGGFLARASMTTSIAPSSCGSLPAATAAGSCSTSTSGATPTFSTTQPSSVKMARLGAVNALPPLKVVQLLGNACLSPTTLAPKDPFRSCVETALHELFSLFSEEPHRVTSNDLVGALGAGPRPEGVGRPAAWLATVSRRCHSVDVFQRGRFLFPRQPFTSPLPKSQPKCINAWPSFKDRSQRSSPV